MDCDGSVHKSLCCPAHIQLNGRFNVNSFAFPPLPSLSVLPEFATIFLPNRYMYEPIPLSYCIDLRFWNLFSNKLQFLLDFFVRFDYFHIVCICIGYFYCCRCCFLPLFMWLSLVNIHLSYLLWKRKRVRSETSAYKMRKRGNMCICTWRWDVIQYNKMNANLGHEWFARECIWQCLPLDYVMGKCHWTSLYIIAV